MIQRTGRVDTVFELRAWQPFNTAVEVTGLSSGSQTIDSALKRPSPLTANQELDLVTTLAHHMPWLPQKIEYFRGYTVPPGVPAERAGQLDLERDGVRTALDSAGFRLHPLSDWRYADHHQNYVEGMPFETEPVEDSMVRHDWTHLTGWTPTEDSRLDTRTYISPDKTQGLTIFHANKISLETATGADLIYVDETRNATVLIQYKRLDERDAANIAGYRSDDQLDEKLHRLQAVDDHFAQLPKSDRSDAFRLLAHPCYIKLCFPKIKLDCGSEPIPGMIMPLDYFNRKYRDIKASSTGNSAVFTKEKIGRYLNSTQTIELIKGGWLGTQSAIYAGFALKRYIDDALAERSVMLAAKRSFKPKNDPQMSLF